MGTQEEGSGDGYQVSQAPAAWPGRQAGLARVLHGLPDLWGSSS